MNRYLNPAKLSRTLLTHDGSAARSERPEAHPVLTRRFIDIATLVFASALDVASRRRLS